MPVYKYKNYEEYKNVQIEGNKRKLNFCWAVKDDIGLLSKYIQREVPDLKFGICHGTRQGMEQMWFREFLGVDVIGTEISPTANKFSHTIQWDFHNVKPEWIDAVDFIYSNSFDHSYKPKECVDAWMSCVKKAGVCIIEWSKGHIPVTKLDPYGGNLDQFRNLFSANHRVKEIIPAIGNKETKARKTCFLVVVHA